MLPGAWLHRNLELCFLVRVRWESDTIGGMRFLIFLSVGWVAAAQIDNHLLQNTGNPMLVDYQCSEEDIRTAGLSCTVEDPCPVFLELASVEAVGNRIFVAGNIHSSTTTLSSVFLSSDDAGKTWGEPHERIRLGGLDHIQFIDFENGWVSGELQHPLPRDPFLLATSDGGKTWQARPIFAEPLFGSILQFRFSSRTNGSLVVDRGRTGESGRYEMYETPNAGETWMLRQTNERLIELMSAIPKGDWRLRADASSKSYRVERRAGNGWHSVAAFSVSIGACKPAEVPVPTAPPIEGVPAAPQGS
jgi:hypothetical protein